MKFDTPLLLHEKPERHIHCFLDKLKYDVLLKVYYRTMLSEAQNHKCCWCGCMTTEQRDKKNSSTIEHIIPKSLGGKNVLDNYAMACYKCNNKRNTLTIEKFMELRNGAQV